MLDFLFPPGEREPLFVNESTGQQTSRGQSRGTSWLETDSESQSTGGSTQWSRGAARDRGFGGNANWSENRGHTSSVGGGSSWSETVSEGESDVPMLIPVMGDELSHVQFRSLEEQLFWAMAALSDQEQRQCVVRLEGMRAPVSLFTPFVKEGIARRERIERYVKARLAKLPYAMTRDEAVQRLAAREAQFDQKLLPSSAIEQEPTTSKRRLK
jgi:hypothetical protein